MTNNHDDLRAQLRRLASSDSGVKVRELTWREYPSGNCDAVVYSISNTYGQGPRKYVLARGFAILGYFDEVDAAKAAAQADYETRIRSALVEVPAVKGEPERVATPGVALLNKLWSQIYDKRPAGDPKDTYRELKAILTAPPADAGMREALESLQAWCDNQGALLGAVDGYDYHSGQEAAYRHVSIEIGKRMDAALTAPGATTKSDGGCLGSLPSGESEPAVTPAWSPSDPSSTRSESCLDRSPLRDSEIKRTKQLAERFGWEPTRSEVTVEDMPTENTTIGGVTWHSSEEDGGPDVGISVYLAPDDRLWCGEISRRLFEGHDGSAHFDSDGGAFIVRFNGKDTTLIAKCADLDTGREFVEQVAAWVRATPSSRPEVSDSDCEDQGLCSTDECIKFSCQTWNGDGIVRPKLVQRGPYWVCPKCHSSYGADAKGSQPAGNLLEMAAKAAFREAQSVYRSDHDHFPLTNTWEGAGDSVRNGWRKIALAVLLSQDEYAIAKIILPYFDEDNCTLDAARALLSAYSEGKR